MGILKILFNKYDVILKPRNAGRFVYMWDWFDCGKKECPNCDEDGNCKHDCPKMIHKIDLLDCPACYLFGQKLYATYEEAENHGE